MNIPLLILCTFLAVVSKPIEGNPLDTNVDGSPHGDPPTGQPVHPIHRGLEVAHVNHTAGGRALKKEEPPKKKAAAVKTKFPSIEGEGKCPKRRKNRIVGGIEAQPHDHPTIVSVAISGVTECGGTIIRPEWVVTAAHCIGSKDPKTYVVTAGDHKRSVQDGTEQVRNVTRVIVHEKYNKKTDVNDIALFKVSPPFQYNGYVNQVTLPFKDFIPEEWVTVVGWGALNEGADKGSDTLQQVDLPTIEDDECEKLYPKHIVLPTMMCTLKEEGGQDACQGDSGGPVYSGKLKVLVGVVSWGEGCAVKNKPGVFTEVSYYLDWIKEHIDTPVTPPPTAKPK